MKYIILALLVTYALSATSGMYELILDEDYDYSLIEEDERMLGFPWADFKVTKGENIVRVSVFVSTTKNYVGKWQGAWGTSTKLADEGYWYMTKDFGKSFTKKTGIISWEIEPEVSEIIQQEEGGELKWGVWWMDCNDFTIDKIVVYTDAFTGDFEDEEEIKAVKESKGVYTAEVGDKYTYNKLGSDKMLPLNWDWFDMIPESEVITAIDVNLSTTAEKLGKWQGAFGSSTGVAPEYWIMTEDMQETLPDKTGSVTWEIDSATNKLLKTADGGQIKFGVWWIDCNTFTIDSVTIHTK